jgi:ribosomal protein S6--L-glutamate ligase
LKIGILSRKIGLYSTLRLKEAIEARGHQAQVIDHMKCYMNIMSAKPSIHFDGQSINDLDAIIPRIGASSTFFGTAVVRQFEMMGVYSINESVAISRSRDKLRSLQLLSRKGIGLPITVFGNSKIDVADMIEMVGGAPLVIKLLEGTQGIGVVLAETKNAAESVINAFNGVRANVLVQEYIKEANGCDIRCFVVGDKVIAAMQRVAKKGEFRSNLHLGGTAEAVVLSTEERATAIMSAQIMGLNLAGVDIIRSNHGPVVLEINSSPGLEGIEKITGEDIASRIIEYIEVNAEKGKTKTKGDG